MDLGQVHFIGGNEELSLVGIEATVTGEDLHAHFSLQLIFKGKHLGHKL